MKTSAKKISTQTGIFLPVLSVLLLSITAVIFVMYLNSYTLNKYETKFRVYSKNLCRNLMQDDEFNLPAKVAANFAANINGSFAVDAQEFGNRDIFRLTRADLVLPTMPANGFHSLTNTSQRQPENSTSYLLNTLAAGVKKSNSTLKVHVNQPYLNLSAFNLSENAQITAICRLEAQVATIDLSKMLFGDQDQNNGWRTIVATYAYWRPLAGDFKDHRFGGATANGEATWPGVVLAVAPHMTTDATLPQFDWSTMNNSIHSPVRGLDEFNTQLGYTESLSSTPYVAVGITNDKDVPSMYLPSGTPQIMYGHPANISGTTTAGDDSALANLPSDLQESLIALANPATLVRNLFTSTFSQYASRHAHMRYAEVLMAGTEHSVAARGFPVLLNTIGSDMLSTTEGILPAVFYNDGISVINPFESNNIKDRILANQLRIAAHLYQANQIGGSYNFIEAPISAIYTGVDRSLNLERAEDYGDDGTSIPVFSENMKTFVQTDFYADTNSPNYSIRYSADTRHGVVDTISLLGMLGSIQECPYKFEISPGVYCDKPAPAADLQPDYVAMLNYLSGNGFAIKSPGIFPIANANPADGKYFVSAAYRTGVASNWPVVLVTHKAPTDSQTATLKTFFGESSPNNVNWPDKRSIFIVFIPTNSTEAASAKIDKFKEAFRIVVSAGHEAAQRVNHHLITISPNSDPLTTDYHGMDNSDFANFFADLIEPPNPSEADRVQPQDSIDRRAHKLFLRLLENAKRKF